MSSVHRTKRAWRTLLLGLSVVGLSLAMTDHSAAHVETYPIAYGEVRVPKARVLELCQTVNVSKTEAFAAWSSSEQLESWLAPKVEMEPEVGGTFRVQFSEPHQPYVGTGSLNILSYEKPDRLFFTWDAPEQFPHVRSQRSAVDVSFFTIDDSRTLVRLTQMGWGSGPEWDDSFDYFERAWTSFLHKLPQASSSTEISGCMG